MADEARDCIAPSEVAHGFSEKVMPVKAAYRKSKMFVLAIAAGAFIAFGAQVSLTVTSGVAGTLGWGLAKLIGAMVFSAGLMMVVLTGAELFTGNVMMMFSVLEKKISWVKLLRSWSIVYVGNFVGSMLLALLVFCAALYQNNGFDVGVNTLTNAHMKVNLSFAEAFARGVLCNWLVCLAVWMATSSKRVIGKIFAIFFPIMTFVASGYEHSVANMFFIPSGILLKSVPQVVAASHLGADVASLSWGHFFLNNLLPVTIGNVVGALIFVVLLFWIAYLKDDHNNNNAND